MKLMLTLLALSAAHIGAYGPMYYGQQNMGMGRCPMTGYNMNKWGYNGGSDSKKVIVIKPSKKIYIDRMVIKPRINVINILPSRG